MGKSRSATCVIAYLMQKHNISVSEALAHVRQARSIVEPNPGFMKQLDLYAEMQTPSNVEDSPAYQRWRYQREVELSRASGLAPEPDKIRFEDEHATDAESALEMRCRKCRSVAPRTYPARSLSSYHVPGSALTRSQTAARHLPIPHPPCSLRSRGPPRQATSVCPLRALLPGPALVDAT